MDCVEFELRIVGLSGRSYRAVVDKSPYGKGASRLFELPAGSSLLLEGGAESWRTLRRRSRPQDKTMLRALLERGKELFERVFEGEVHLALRRSLELARDNGHWFRLQLAFEAAPEAAEWPWEALVGPDDQALSLRDIYSAVMGKEPPPQKEARLPVVSLDRDEVQQFLNTVNERDPSRGFRLPTEAEWEYAARAGTDTAYTFGDDPKDLPRYGNCKGGGPSLTDGFEDLAPVGSLRPNPWGFYDVHGNVWELVADRWGHYPAEHQIDPLGPSHGELGVRRGGAHDAAADNCTSAARKQVKERRQKTNGVRIARTSVR